MVIEPQFTVPGDARAEASEPLATPLNTDTRVAGIDETDRASPYSPLRQRRIALMLRELQALHNANQASPRDYGNYRQPPFDGTFGNQAQGYGSQNPLGMYYGGR